MRLETRIRALVTLGVLLSGMLALAGWFGAGVALGATSSYRSDVQTVQEPVGEGCLPWSHVYPPNPRTHHYLNGVDALAPDDIWAVGRYYDENNFTPDTTLAMHWDGVAWTIFPTPPVGGYLLGVDAFGPNDVWAVGHCPDCGMTSLTMHWDGVQWTRIPSPSPPGYITLHDVVALAPDNVWAVGANDGGHSTVAMNWDGTAWSIVPTPNGGMFGDDNVLTSVTAISPTDMWAVGYIYPKGGTPRTLSIHWDGSQWTLVNTPNPGNYSRRLDGVTALAANDVWAVGAYSSDLGSTYTPLFLHWTGAQWEHVPSPQIGDYNSLRDVHAIAPNDVWAVGTTAGCNFCPFETLTMHWDGTAWAQEYSPNGSRKFSRLEGVTATSSSNVWAVGFTDEISPGYSDALTMHRVCVVPTPTGTPPTVTPTRTSVSTYTSTPTRTVAATPTCNPNGLRVLIVYADYQSPPNTLRNGILSYPGVQTVDFYRADSTTPTLQQLMQYDVVVAFARVTSWADATTLGNRLADYEDAQGIVVAFNFSWSGPPRGISGRWQSENYSPYQNYGGNIYGNGTLGAHNAAHPLMQGVTNLSAYYRANLVLKPGAEQIAAWNDGRPLIAVKGRAIGVSAYVGDADGGWSGDYARIVVNAGQWLRGGQCGTPVSTSTPLPPTATRTATPTETPGGPTSCTVPSFGPRTNFAVGDAPERITVGDFNNDGNLDLATVNKESYNISVLLGNGSGGFGPAATFELDNEPAGITAGDFNRDGNLDLAAAGFGTDMALVLLGSGTGGFGPATGYGSGSTGAGIATADFNQDGILDLVIADSGQDNMLVLRGNGSGGFGSPLEYDLDWIPTDITVGDFNRDGNPDTAATNSFSDNVSVWLGNGSGGFGSPANYNVGANPRSIAVSDFNRDGNPDFVTSSPETFAVSVRLGNGTGGFGQTYNFPAGNGSESIGIADFNFDGNPDLAVANVPGNVAVLLGNGSGGFGPFTNFAAGSGPFAVAVGDFNSDNRPDLAVTNTNGDNVSALLNTCPAVVATPTGSPQATSTVVPPSSTSIPSTQTVGVGTTTATASVVATASIVASTTATPGACTVTFTDVTPGSTFYTNIMCLACRGIVSGYSDGTFRPNNEVTRGQLAKIVSNSAGFSEPVSGQTFQDVPSSNTFYEWIERLTGRGYMSGYVCGGPGEPCNTGRPYFRPFANATRGQTSKIVSNAAGFTETPTGQTFEDVPPTHTFYTEIQRLASRNIMGGYACGGPGEPCLSGKPYFRPGNNVTRGQSSKIVANTFFPACNPYGVVREDYLRRERIYFGK